MTPRENANDALEIQGQARFPASWYPTFKIAATIIGLVGGGAGFVSVTKSDTARPTTDEIAEVKRQIADVGAAAAEAKTLSATTSARVDSLVDKVNAVAVTLDKTNDKLDAANAKLNQLVGAIGAK